MVVAVISILVAIIIPALGGAQNSAKRAKTRVQFSQWSAAIEQFRQEYGYYPNWGTGTNDSNFANGLIDTQAKSQRFVECLSGRQVDGSPITDLNAPGLLAGNTERINFCTFGNDTLTSGNLLQDAFEKTNIVVLTDRNLSGTITFQGTDSDYSSAPPDVGSSPSPITATSTIIRAGVVFYSEGDGQTAVTSW